MRRGRGRGRGTHLDEGAVLVLADALDAAAVLRPVALRLRGTSDILCMRVCVCGWVGGVGWVGGAKAGRVL